MSDEFALSLQIKPGRSTYLLSFIASIHVLALIAAILNGFPWPVKTVVFSAVLVSLYWYLKWYGLFGPIQDLIVRHTEGDGWTLQFDEGAPKPVKLLGSSVVTRLLCVLHFKNGGKVIPVLIPRDSLAQEDYRKLRVLIKISGHA